MREALNEWYREKQLETWKKRKSQCIKGRTKHIFRRPKTKSLTPDLKCWYCRKTVAQVKAEQRTK
jgi:hypothetical protein